MAQREFVHPGGVYGKTELDYVKAKVTAHEQPWIGQFIKMRQLAVASTNTSAPGDESGQKEDGKKACANALAWYYTGDETYAKNAIGILNTWGQTFAGYRPVDGQNLLQGGWIGALLGPAAEIMRDYPGWTSADRSRVQTMFKTAFYPVLNKMSTWNGNVDLTQIDAMLNIAVFCEDEEEFELGLRRLRSRSRQYFYLVTDGPLSDQNQWFNPQKLVNGLTQETCRDNGHHSQYGMASALRAAEVAWNQGVDVYGENRERYTAAIELLATQLLSGSMDRVCSDNTPTSDLYSTWEIGYNHYHHRQNISLPNTRLLIIRKVRTESHSEWNIFFESLTHNLDGQ